MRRRLRYRLAQVLIRFTARLVWGLRVEGIENIPADGSFILASNHKSYLDPPLLGAPLPRELRYFAKKQLFSIPILGRTIRGYGAIPIDREGFDRRGIAQALDVLAAGEGLVVFPEGTRIRRPGLGRPREGVGLLTLKSGAPVVPAHLSGTWEPRRRWYRRVPIEVRYGRPIRFPAVSGKDARAQYAAVAAAVLEAIAALRPADGPRGGKAV